MKIVNKITLICDKCGEMETDLKKIAQVWKSDETHDFCPDCQSQPTAAEIVYFTPANGQKIEC